MGCGMKIRRNKNLSEIIFLICIISIRYGVGFEMGFEEMFSFLRMRIVLG